MHQQQSLETSGVDQVISTGFTAKRVMLPSTHEITERIKGSARRFSDRQSAREVLNSAVKVGLEEGDRVRFKDILVLMDSIREHEKRNSRVEVLCVRREKDGAATRFRLTLGTLLTRDHVAVYGDYSWLFSG